MINSLEFLIAKNNFIYDDMIHLVYVNNAEITNSLLANARSDGMDIDISKGILIKNLIVENSVNDCIDFMTSEGIIKESRFKHCNDKGISIGENSRINIVNSSI